MVLEELHTLIETLQQRIDGHAAELQKSEALTRYTLIDPLLRGLGWDTSDPSQVLVEFKSTHGRADYALLGGQGRPQIIIEAKSLGTDLGSAVTQVINYCIQDGFEYFAVTDGRHWQVYETNRPGPLAERLVTRLDVRASVGPTCLNALALWRPSVVAGSVQTATTPVVTPSTPNILPDPSPPRPKLLPDVEDGPWQSLADFSPVKGSKPAATRTPQGEIIQTLHWTDVTKCVVSWLVRHGHFTCRHLPIQRGQRYLMSQSPIHPTGSPFANPHDLQGLQMEMDYSSVDQIKNSRFIVEYVGLDPADFAVRMQ